MPRVAGVIDLCCIQPLDVDTSDRDVDGCLQSTVSDYGYVTHTTTLTRDPTTKRITNVAHSVSDA